MAMHNPPHPGEFITEVYLEPNDLSGRELAALGRSPESWLALQYNYDLWRAKQRVKLGNVGRVRLTAA
jgi:plasmid maintenance system antidote protein VapI